MVVWQQGARPLGVVGHRQGGVGVACHGVNVATVPLEIGLGA